MDDLLGSSAMNRREFLLLKTEGRKRVFELSCEQLYMQYVDAQSAAKRRSEKIGTVAGSPWWSGEPPASMDSLDLDELFGDLESDLTDADILQVLDRDWLVSGEFRKRFDTLLASFRARGGQVQFSRDKLGVKP